VFALLIGAARTRAAQAVTVLVLTALATAMAVGTTRRHATARPFMASR
jgi:hypothetical protein